MRSAYNICPVIGLRSVQLLVLQAEKELYKSVSSEARKHNPYAAGG